MKTARKQTLLNKAESLSRSIDRELEKESFRSWGSFTQRLLHDTQKAMDVVLACLDEIVPDKEEDKDGKVQGA